MIETAPSRLARAPARTAWKSASDRPAGSSGPAWPASQAGWICARSPGPRPAGIARPSSNLEPSDAGRPGGVQCPATSQSGCSCFRRSNAAASPVSRKAGTSISSWLGSRKCPIIQTPAKNECVDFIPIPKQAPTLRPIALEPSRAFGHHGRVRNLPRGRAAGAALAKRGASRRRRNRPPETLRHKGPRMGPDLWKAAARLVAHRRSKGAAPRP